MTGFQSWKQALNDTVIANTPMQELQTVVRTTYRSFFEHAVATGRAKPTFISYFALPFLLVSLWLSIPHTQTHRAWVYQTRWLVVLAVVGLNVYHVLYASSTNFAVMYLIGLASTYLTMMTLHLLVWTRPQFDSARVIRVRKSEGRTLRCRSRVDGIQNGQEHGACQNDHVDENHLRQRKGVEIPSANKKVDESLKEENEEGKRKEEFEYVWQPFPADGTFFERFGWSVDLVSCLRGSGWTHSISPLPRPTLPKEIRLGDLVDIDSIPRISGDGISRCLTEAEFFRDRSRKALIYYFLLDFCSVMAMKDPYFILGPDLIPQYNLPPYLAWMPSWLCRAYRDVLVLFAVLVSINGFGLMGELIHYRIMKQIFPSRAIVWLYFSAFGSFQQTLDRGMAGWWGSFWHQTFRMQFQGPVTFLLRKGYLKKGSFWMSVLSPSVAFFQSGILHASGSLTTLPPTKPWWPFAFFMVQTVAIAIQMGATRILKPLFFARGQTPSRNLRWTVNFLYAYACFYIMGRLFFDDVASSGITMFEPVPISPLRFLGLGQPGDHWWRWDRESFPQWYSIGEHWWQSGIAI